MSAARWLAVTTTASEDDEPQRSAIPPPLPTVAFPAPPPWPPAPLVVMVPETWSVPAAESCTAPELLSRMSPAFAPAFVGTAFEVHNIGEVWCMALLEVRARFITRLGYAAGNQRILQFVTDGLKMDPLNPTPLTGRDAILASLEPELEDVLRVLGAKRWDVLMKIGLPRSKIILSASPWSRRSTRSG